MDAFSLGHGVWCLIFSELTNCSVAQLCVMPSLFVLLSCIFPGNTL